MKRMLLFLALILCLPCRVSWSGLISAELRSLPGSHEPVPVIVTLAEKVDPRLIAAGPEKRLRRILIVRALKEKADSTQQPVIAHLQARGIEGAKGLWITNAVAAKLSPALIRELAAFPSVERIDPDRAVKVPETVYTSASTPEWNLSAINAPDIWYEGYSGQGVVVANMDTGVDADHPDLKTKWRGGTNSWHDPNGEHSAPYDANGHGTQTMGLMVGGDAGGTSVGVAPDATWIAVKIYNDAGTTTYSIIHQGFQWLLDPDGDSATTDGPDVVNLSWDLDSINGCVTEFQSDIAALKAAGIAVAVSAGNYGPNASTSVSPANNSGVFSVGAVDETQRVATFSSRGPSACGPGIFPSLVAPGVNVRTTDLTFGGTFPNSYVNVAGTSFSSPHVAGSMALLLSAFPDLTPEQIDEALRLSTTDLGASGPDNAYGQGLVNVAAAYVQLGGTLPVKIAVTSMPLYDGWVAESKKGSGVGGTTATGNIMAGDDLKGRQRKGFLSFNTSRIPADAEILSATLKLTRAGLRGENPFSVLGTCDVDVMKGVFNKKALQKRDFQAPATAPGSAVISDPLESGGISTGSLTQAGMDAINKGGITQMRLSFSTPTNDDKKGDAVIFCSGEATKARRPTLEIRYQP